MAQIPPTADDGTSLPSLDPASTAQAFPAGLAETTCDIWHNECVTAPEKIVSTYPYTHKRK